MAYTPLDCSTAAAMEIALCVRAKGLLTCYCSHTRMTRGTCSDIVWAFALNRAVKIVRGLRQGLTEDERYAVADHAVADCPAF